MAAPLPVVAQPRIAVPMTSATVVIDGYLDMSSEWNGSAAVAWYSPMDGYEMDTVYLLHNATHYLIAARLYDPDSRADDELRIYVGVGSATYEYVMEEGSSAVSRYNTTAGGCAAVPTGAAGTMTRTWHWSHWIYAELAVPKDEWGRAEEVALYFEHLHTHRLTVLSRYPENASPSDTGGWLRASFAEPAEAYSVTLRFLDRGGGEIGYVSGVGLAEVRFSNGTLYTSVAPNGSSLNLLLPPGNYTVTFYVYGIPVFNTSLSVSSNVTATYSMNNLEHVVTGYGDIVAVVELPGEIGCIYLEPGKQLGMLITNSTEPVALRIFPEVAWNYSFVAVLNAFNFTYNPYTKSLLAYAPGNFSGIMMIGAPEGYPVFFFANGTVRGYVYNHELEELSAWIGSGTYMVYHIKTPFAVTLNNTALKRGADYSTDPFNVTALSVGGGELRVYFRNPAMVSLSVAGATARIVITAPYRFNGSYTLRVKSGGATVATRTGSFTASIPLTVVEVPLGDLGPGSYTVEATVVDSDSQQTLGTASTSYLVEAPTAPEEEEVPWENYLLLLLIALLAVAAIAAFRAAGRATVERLEGRRRFVKER